MTEKVEPHDPRKIPAGGMTDEQLIAAAYSEAAAMSFYNAAESPQWGLETEARNRCQARLNELLREVDKRELSLDLKGYLL